MLGARPYSSEGFEHPRMLPGINQARSHEDGWRSLKVIFPIYITRRCESTSHTE